eukprot:CAMPEP_0197825686 /NCGR_PEP_ID=MMETSP1437-20131217/2726_1 /TAXON_ID=49252 ORGANISM="Eucampia antarctica, Strain CCMP1452" /NCGR_SAMPLE_ID=MMETSP1437 /ASSEMBLY_ACC=CAM_ASM_001096 /LENGTH=242 /DNA_ID=CAMNT_0043425797 /DNA_START=66 /DNA_END=794 /DNA_ORIENTATION=+
MKSLSIAALILLTSSNLYHVEAFAFKPRNTGNTSKNTLVTKDFCSDIVGTIGKGFVAAVVTLSVFAGPDPAFADGQTKDFKFPPIDKTDKNRCAFASSKMGQANAARDKLYDLRQCNLSGKDASGFDLSGVIMSGTDVSKAKFLESQFSKAFLQDSNFDGADFTNGIIDRASFRGSSLRGAIFKNAVLTGTSFEGADLENSDFTDSYIGSFDIRNICKNPTLKGENPLTGADSALSAGCIPK